MLKKLIISVTLLAFFITSLSGCATTDQYGRPDASRSAGSGALIGGIAGALGGFLATGKVSGAIKYGLIGAAAGGLTGFIIGKSRERQYKTANQVYSQNPALTRVSTKNRPPAITSVNPLIYSQNGRPIKAIKNGEWVELATRYQIEIPKYSNVKQVEVVEYNTLISPDGKKSMNNPELRRTKIRSCGAVESAITVKVPKNLPDGKYRHYAMVSINGKNYETIQDVQIVMIERSRYMFALN